MYMGIFRKDDSVVLAKLRLCKKCYNTSVKKHDTEKSRFNLVYDKWIPVEGQGKHSLYEVFANPLLQSVGGNPLQKMAVYKFLFLIAQHSCGFLTEIELRKTSKESVARKCLRYLEKNSSLFNLYGDKAFLQNSEIKDNNKIKYQTMYIDYIPDLASDNDSIVKETQTKLFFSDADKALYLLTLLSYSLGGKRTTNPKDYLSSTEQDDRRQSAKPSPSVSNGTKGYVQTILLGSNIIETIYLNFFTREDLSLMNINNLEDCLPPWERLPTFKTSDYNSLYKKSFAAWFMPMTRAVFLGETNELKYCEDLRYTGEWHDPFLTETDKNGKKETVDVLKKPWNQIQALLTEIYCAEKSKKKCPAVSLHYIRAKETTEFFSIWTGGLSMDAHAGDQYVKNENDYIESCVTFSSDILGEEFFSRYCSIIDKVNTCGDALQKSIETYKTDLKLNVSSKKEKFDSITGCMFQFWYEMRKRSEEFIRTAEEDNEEKQNCLLKKIYSMARNIYDDYCQHGTARQLAAWIKNRP